MDDLEQEKKLHGLVSGSSRYCSTQEGIPHEIISESSWRGAKKSALACVGRHFKGVRAAVLYTASQICNNRWVALRDGVYGGDSTGRRALPVYNRSRARNGVFDSATVSSERRGELGREASSSAAEEFIGLLEDSGLTRAAASLWKKDRVLADQ